MEKDKRQALAHIVDSLAAQQRVLIVEIGTLRKFTGLDSPVESGGGFVGPVTPSDASLL